MNRPTLKLNIARPDLTPTVAKKPQQQKRKRKLSPRTVAGKELLKRLYTELPVLEERKPLCLRTGAILAEYLGLGRHNKKLSMALHFHTRGHTYRTNLSHGGPRFHPLSGVVEGEITQQQLDAVEATLKNARTGAVAPAKVPLAPKPPQWQPPALKPVPQRAKRATPQRVPPPPPPPTQNTAPKHQKGDQ